MGIVVGFRIYAVAGLEFRCCSWFLGAFVSNPG